MAGCCLSFKSVRIYAFLYSFHSHPHRQHKLYFTKTCHLPYTPFYPYEPLLPPLTYTTTLTPPTQHPHLPQHPTIETQTETATFTILCTDSLSLTATTLASFFIMDCFNSHILIRDP
jgi:hypothetical protein